METCIKRGDINMTEFGLRLTYDGGGVTAIRLTGLGRENENMREICRADNVAQGPSMIHGCCNLGIANCWCLLLMNC